jgi:hypothetical protein
MATDIAAFVQFSDGSFASLLAEGATAETVTSLPTGGAQLNQVTGVEIGQAYEGKTAVAAWIQTVRSWCRCRVAATRQAESLT